MKVINFFAGPGVGKSVTAVDVYSALKKKQHNAELVTEYAKQLVWSERQNMFSKQMYIFAKQEYALDRLRNKVDFAITDSPLLLSAIYQPPGYYPTFMPLVHEVFHSYDNINIVLERNTEFEYQQIGRNQNEQESDNISADIVNFLTNYKIPFHTIKVDEYTADKVLNLLGLTDETTNR